MKRLRGVVTVAVVLAVGLLGAAAAFGAGELTVNPDSIDCSPADPQVIPCIYFGEADGPVSETITLSNDGTEDLEVTDIALATYPLDAPEEVDNFDFTVVGETIPFHISVGGSVDVEVTWAPSGQRRDRAILRITHDAGAPIDIDLGGGKPFVFLPADGNVELGNVNIAQPPVGMEINQDGFNSHDWIRLRHSGPAFPNVTVTGCPTKSPAEDELFRVRCVDPNPVLTTVANTIIYRTGFHPDTTGEKSVAVDFSVGTEVITVDVSGTGVEGDALYRVNSGGAIVDVDPTSQSFTRDQAGNRSAYFLVGDGSALTNTAAIDTSDSSIPAATPSGIFATARTEGDAATPIRYAFPVDAEVYTVRLFFVEADTNITGSGQRVFDVTINESLALSGLDVFNVAGGHDHAFARAFLVDASGPISIDVERQTGTPPPVLSGVEIVSGGSAELDAPDNVDFGSVTVGNTDSDTLTISNDAGPLGAAVRIDDVDLSGAGADDYEVSGLPAWVAPGEDLELEVEFTPSETGARPATATVEVHGGSNLVVSLTGTGLPAPDPDPEPEPDPDPEPEPDPDPDPDPEPEPDPVSFVDIAGSTFTQDILWLAKVGVTRGCNPPVNDRFCPDDFVTRGQMAAFFVRALGLTERLDDPFIDDNGHTFEADIEKLAAADITRGCNPPVNNRFCPNDFVTRGQMAAFFVRAVKLTDRLDDPFVDDNGHTFEADIEKLAAADITRGCNPPVNNRFCPDEHVTRGQMAAFFHRAADLLGLPR